jgi:hypothetical protein
MQTILGRKVQIAPADPHMQVSTSFARIQSPELVAATNAWMTEFFGCTERMPDGLVYEYLGDTLIMNRATYDRLVEAAKASAT